MFKVIAECVDRRSGKRYGPGQEFDPPPDPDQASRLVKSGCLQEVSDISPEGTVLEAQRVTDLKALAVRHDVDVSNCRNKAEIIAALQTAGVSAP